MRGLTDDEATFLRTFGNVSHMRQVADDLVTQGRLRIVAEGDGWDHAYQTPAGQEALRLHLAGYPDGGPGNR